MTTRWSGKELSVIGKKLFDLTKSSPTFYTPDG
jgi:hypothetical protein